MTEQIRAKAAIYALLTAFVCVETSALSFAQSAPLPPQRPANAAPANTTPAVQPQSPGASAVPAQANSDRPAYEITGFRAARFGMTADEVRAAIKTDFAITGDGVRVAQNQIERTTIFSITLPTLEPGPGPAQVSYILGFTSKKLIQINVLWSPAQVDAAQADRSRYLIAGVSLAQYFTSFSWGQNRAVQAAVTGPNTVLLFAGEDSGTGATQVVADGVEFERQTNGKQEPSSKPTNPPSLLVSYIENRTKPDVFRIEKGRF